MASRMEIPKKNGKRKGMNSSGDRIPKNAQMEKHCALCQKYGGAHTTHNTNKCSKYEKDCTEKAGWSIKLPSNLACKYKKPDSSYAQLQKCFEKLEKSVKKGEKGSSSRKKKHYHSSDSDSDSD